MFRGFLPLAELFVVDSERFQFATLAFSPSAVVDIPKERRLRVALPMASADYDQNRLGTSKTAMNETHQEDLVDQIVRKTPQWSSCSKVETRFSVHLLNILQNKIENKRVAL
jgi:hypothetical protein